MPVGTVRTVRTVRTEVGKTYRSRDQSPGRVSDRAPAIVAARPVVVGRRSVIAWPAIADVDVDRGTDRHRDSRARPRTVPAAAVAPAVIAAAIAPALLLGPVSAACQNWRGEKN